MGDAIQLLAHRRIDRRMAMPVQIAPQAAHPVEQTPPVDRGQPASLGPLNDQRLVLGHLGEAVPNVGDVPGGKFGG